jgi:hypothetical protein
MGNILKCYRNKRKKQEEKQQQQQPEKFKTVRIQKLKNNVFQRKVKKRIQAGNNS